MASHIITANLSKSPACSECSSLDREGNFIESLDGITVIQCLENAAGHVLTVSTISVSAEITDNLRERDPGTAVQFYVTACGKIIDGLPMGERVLTGEISQCDVDTLASELEQGATNIPARRDTNIKPDVVINSGAPTSYDLEAGIGW